jgi:hypothetical protein
MERITTSRVPWLLALLSIAVLTSPRLLAQDDELRGKMSMSVYVSLVGRGSGALGVNGAELRLSMEQQLHDMGITVLPHGNPPNFPVLVLTVDQDLFELVTTVTQPNTGNSGTLRQPVVSYSMKIELRQLAPGRTIAMRPIEDVAIWSKSVAEQKVMGTASWRITGEALDLATQFVTAWQRANPGTHPATADKPLPVVNVSALKTSASGPGQALYSEGNCPTRAAGGCVVDVGRSVIDSIEAVPNAQFEMVAKQLGDLQKRGQKVITCVYGPSNAQAKTGFVTYHFWYQSAPPDILRLLTSAFPHPFMNLGRVAVNGCPSTRDAADEIQTSRFN